MFMNVIFCFKRWLYGPVCYQERLQRMKMYKESSSLYDRRNFLYRAACSGLALLVFDSYSNNAAADPADLYAYKIMKSVSSNPNSVLAVGKQCLLKRLKTNVDAATSFTTLKRVISKSNGNFVQDSRAYKLFLHSQIDTEFQKGQVVLVDGWYLSETEALYCTTLAWVQMEISQHVL